LAVKSPFGFSFIIEHQASDPTSGAQADKLTKKAAARPDIKKVFIDIIRASCMRIKKPRLKAKNELAVK
jgi:hypothetical protein